jgi:2-polyprenyl-3-methyl-5-hydroxy-6-metoxy-1,4-benzoquinol methylase
MFSNKYRSDQLELLDEVNIPTEDLYRNLYELEVINKNLGGHNATFKGLSYFNFKLNVHTLLDIGSGGGDTLRAIAKSKFGKYFNTLDGADLKKDCITYANLHSRDFKTISYHEGDYKLRLTQNELQYDVISNALFCHHFKDEQLIEMLKLMQYHCKLGFIINDLQRHWLAYYSIKILTALFSKSYLVKNDAPLSVARSFKKSDWEKLLAKAGIEGASIKWSWAFRYVIIWKK